MSEWVDATGNPKGFVDAVSRGQKVFADFKDDCYLSWDDENILYVFLDRNGEETASLFPALFKRTDEDMEEVFTFYDAIHKELLRRELEAMKSWGSAKVR
jgi:hypothetical protein